MPDLTISRVAKQFGLRASALRYYEQIGVLPATYRRGGQRLYDESAVRRLAIVQRARELGFTIKETQILFSDFSCGPPISERWHSLCGAKLEELEIRIDQIHEMQHMLQKMMQCRCAAFDQCGAGILEGKRKRSREREQAAVSENSADGEA
ncbi:MAG TPA: MerR family transcriptional regulator [Sphingomicrobium sp.]|nr:MerR family transcriptional regulator [Sphingomicrobium sp.]